MGLDDRPGNDLLHPSRAAHTDSPATHRRRSHAGRRQELTEGARTLRHPLVGGLTLDWDARNCVSDPDQQLVVWSAEPSSPSWRTDIQKRHTREESRTPEILPLSQ
ncbi:hypothetical protein H1V43_36305 [Streptomyces sp. PSKA54]|uniref:MmyB-like transcription regulator ligand binding domain-containing protein n=1 Tax=Streptomyces himalayensis subsp. aureolus TaxID=2758039 RepID=A0A7W2HK10_9ACTN|nr:hypothetical protein [Streptomyces himalayensis]MBA4866668.1 hypothetical protein [Streptomyces himalayensis subsp. aureolus]